MYHGEITYHGEAVPAPDYLRRPFVYGVSPCVCDICGRAVDTHRIEADMELRKWRAVREGGMIVGFVCDRCEGAPARKIDGAVG